MEITAQKVSQLREQTGAGMMECKKALVEAEGDTERARDILRVRGKAGAEKRAGRAAKDGVIAAAASASASAMVELNSETDFVARNDEFKALAADLAALAAATACADPEALLKLALPDGTPAQRKLDDAVAKLRENIVLRRCVVVPASEDTVTAAYIHTVTNKIGVLVKLQGDATGEALRELARNLGMHVAATNPQYTRREDVPADVVEREEQVLAELTRNEGKPEAAIAKIVAGRIGKFFERVCLVEQAYVRDPSIKVAQLLKDAGAEARQFVRFEVGQ